MEIRGVTTDDCGLSFNDAVTYWSNSTSNWIQQQNPSLGAVVCYYTNTTQNQHPGHVAIVEQIIDNDTIVISESHYGGARWDLVTCYRQYGWRPSAGWNVTPLGFLKNPYVDEPQPPTGNTPLALFAYILKKRRLRHAKRITGSL